MSEASIQSLWFSRSDLHSYTPGHLPSILQMNSQLDVHTLREFMAKYWLVPTSRAGSQGTHKHLSPWAESCMLALEGSLVLCFYAWAKSSLAHSFTASEETFFSAQIYTRALCSRPDV